MKRTFKQISVASTFVPNPLQHGGGSVFNIHTAVASDGTAWKLERTEWKQLPELPEQEEEQSKTRCYFCPQCNIRSYIVEKDLPIKTRRCSSCQGMLHADRPVNTVRRRFNCPLCIKDFARDEPEDEAPNGICPDCHGKGMFKEEL